jgi:hypothetical protein
LPSSPITPQLRPLSVGEVLDAGFRLMRHRFGPLVLAVLVPVVPLAVLSTIIAASTDPTTYDINAVVFEDEERSTQATVGDWATILVLGLAAVLAVAAGFKVVSGAYLGERTSAGAALRATVRRLPALIVASLLIGAVTWALVAATTVLYFPIAIAAFLGVKWAATAAAIMGEQAGPFRAMRRSWQLTRGHWWRTFGIVLVPAILTLVFRGSIFFSAELVVQDMDTIEPVTLAVVWTLLEVITLALAYPLAAAVTAVLYYDLRVRREAFDLQLLARHVGGAARPPADEPPDRPGLWTPSPAPATSGGFAPPEGPAAAS